jgi:hypothetical protein
MCPLSCGCPQKVARTQGSLQGHMIYVSTVLRKSTECGQDIVFLAAPRDLCVHCPPAVHRMWPGHNKSETSEKCLSLVGCVCVDSNFTLFCFWSVLFGFPFCSISLFWMSLFLSCLPRPAPQAPSSHTTTAPSALSPIYVFCLNKLSVWFRNITTHSLLFL